MSNLIIFSINEKPNHKKLVTLSKKLIKYCLTKDLGIIFNFLGYSHKLITQLTPSFYFSISDDFLQLNSEYLTTSNIKNIEKTSGKKFFNNKFSFLDDVYNILKNFGIKNITLLISRDDTINDIKEFKRVVKNNRPIVDILYEDIINRQHEYGYDFTDLIILSQLP